MKIPLRSAAPDGSRRAWPWGAMAGFIGMSAIAGLLVTTAIAPAATAASLAVSDATITFNGLPDYLVLQPLDQTTTFYAQKGGAEVPIATFYAQNRQDVPFDQMAQTVKDAAVDTEDPRFYSEGGVDIYGILRGAVADLSGGDVQGGSSITQQYVKNVLVQRCDENDVVDSGASAAEQKKQQLTFESCYQDAAGVTLDRKLREIRYAIGINKRYTKNEILQSYLNIVGFGGEIYGVQAAAKYYFDTSAANLTLSQSATLVAILNDPNYLRIDDQSVKPDDAAPDNDSGSGFAATKARRDYVLQRMLVHHSITQAEYKQAVATPITTRITSTPSGCMSAVKYDAGFFCDYVENVMLQNPAFGKTADERELRFQQGGLNVYTTLNLDLQSTAQSALSTWVPATDPDVDIGGANVSVEVGTGRIVTMVENKQYNDTGGGGPGSTAINYNADYAYGGSNGFQTGSSFKAFDLAAWFEAGHTATEYVDGHYSGYGFPFSDFNASCEGGQLSGGTYTVDNNDSSEGGELSVLQATEQSVNTAFMQMATELDLCAIADAAEALGVHAANPAAPPDGNPFQIVPSMVIGTNYISPLTMATAYAGIANNGIFCTNVAIDKITTTTGASVAVPRSTCKQAIPKDVAAALAWTLQHVLTDGTATPANPYDGIPILAKTGTTDNYEQNWLVTSSSKVANAIWVGQVSGDQNLQYYDYNGSELANAKFSADQTILQALDRVYGGSAFTAAPNSLLYGYTYSPQPYTNAPGTGQGGQNGVGDGNGSGSGGNGDGGSGDGGTSGPGGGPGSGSGGTSTPPPATSTPGTAG